jgi:hypothetical protein
MKNKSLAVEDIDTGTDWEALDSRVSAAVHEIQSALEEALAATRDLTQYVERLHTLSTFIRLVESGLVEARHQLKEPPRGRRPVLVPSKPKGAADAADKPWPTEPSAGEPEAGEEPPPTMLETLEAEADSEPPEMVAVAEAEEPAETATVAEAEEPVAETAAAAEAEQPAAETAAAAEAEQPAAESAAAAEAEEPAAETAAVAEAEEPAAETAAVAEAEEPAAETAAAAEAEQPIEPPEEEPWAAASSVAGRGSDVCLEIESSEANIDLLVVERALRETPGVADVDLLDYSGKRARMRVTLNKEDLPEGKIDPDRLASNVRESLTKLAWDGSLSVVPTE